VLDPEDIRELFFDATERPTRRPTTGQRAFYSGKKKRHTIKNQVVTARRTPGIVVFYSLLYDRMATAHRAINPPPDDAPEIAVQ